MADVWFAGDCYGLRVEIAGGAGVRLDLPVSQPEIPRPGDADLAPARPRRRGRGPGNHRPVTAATASRRWLPLQATPATLYLAALFLVPICTLLVYSFFESSFFGVEETSRSTRTARSLPKTSIGR